MGFGIYVHVPFCVRKCGYCDFCSVGIGDGSPLVGKVVKKLAEEVVIYGEGCDEISSVFIGGGTPSVVPVGEMEPLLATIRKWIDAPDGAAAEWTIECNPGTVDREKLALYREYGVNRLSIGCQSVHDEELRSLGRIHTAEDFYRTYENARACGFDNINVDMMSAIPGQTLASWEETLRQILKLEPEHISAYSLILEPDTPFYEKYADRPPTDEETDRRMYELTCEMLGEAGYLHYEVSNYAKKRIAASTERSMSSGAGEDVRIEERCHACRHNLNYWRRGGYIGIGPAAASFYKSEGEYGTRQTNTTDIAAWLADASQHSGVGNTGLTTDVVRETAGGEREILTCEQALTESVFLGLRMSEGVDMKELSEHFSIEAEEAWTDDIRLFAEQGLMQKDGSRIRLTDEGLFVSDAIIDRLLAKV